MKQSFVPITTPLPEVLSACHACQCSKKKDCCKKYKKKGVHCKKCPKI
ncbi:MAG: hypothetical protein KA734_12340 [Fluviicola sp.]|nr:hypothetical protein [Fluviicola sp.]